MGERSRTIAPSARPRENALLASDTRRSDGVSDGDMAGLFLTGASRGEVDLRFGCSGRMAGDLEPMLLLLLPPPVLLFLRRDRLDSEGISISLSGFLK